MPRGRMRYPSVMSGCYGRLEMASRPQVPRQVTEAARVRLRSDALPYHGHIADANDDGMEQERWDSSSDPQMNNEAWNEISLEQGPGRPPRMLFHTLCLAQVGHLDAIDSADVVLDTHVCMPLLLAIP